MHIKKNVKNCEKDEMLSKLDKIKDEEVATFVQAEIAANGQMKGVHGYGCVQFRGDL